MDGSKVGERVLDLGAIGFPSFGTTGPTISPFYFRTPRRSNFDISLFKNFKITETKTLQFRTGFFNIFNQAFPKTIDNQNASNSDIFLTLDTRCTRTPVNQTLALADGTVTSFTPDPPERRRRDQLERLRPDQGLHLHHGHRE